MDSRVNQEPLAVLWEEVRRPLVHRATTTPALTAPVAPPALAATIIPAAAGMVTPTPLERSQVSCNHKLPHLNFDPRADFMQGQAQSVGAL